MFIFSAPGLHTDNYNPFVMERVFHDATNDTTCLEWSFDSRMLAVGSLDKSTKLYSLDKWANFKHCSLGVHSASIVACFFEATNYDISTVSENGLLCVWECSLGPDDLTPLQPEKKRKKSSNSDDDDEDDVNLDDAVELTEKQMRSREKAMRGKKNGTV